MAARSLNERVEILEQRMEGLYTLPDRVNGLESQILQLRGEMRDGFSATDRRFDQVEGRIQEVDEETRRQMRALHEEALTRLREGDEETRRYMRVLHEDVISRIALLQEGRARRKR